MILEMKIPSPGESITTVEIAVWLVQDGDYVEKDQAIAEIDSDKATLELPAEESGVITLKAEEGDELAVGEIVCLIDISASKPTEVDSSKSSEKQAESKKEIEEEKLEIVEPEKPGYAKGTASPAAAKILAEKQISPLEVIGSGREGRIIKGDALKALSSMGSKPLYGRRESSRKKLSMLRRKLSKRLVSVKNETAMLTTFNEVNMQSIFDLRKEYKEQFKEKHGVNLGFMSFFTLAVVRSLKMYPAVNSMLDGEYQVSYNFYDISIAVSGPKGLMVPVLRNAELLSFRGVEREIKRLALRAREGKITLDEMTGGTFTITNGGVFGSMLSTPILNQPQTAILGMHNIVERPVAEEGRVVIRPMMYLAVSYDHRILDGQESVGFLVCVKEGLEDPIGLLMGNDVKKALEI